MHITKVADHESHRAAHHGMCVMTVLTVRFIPCSLQKSQYFPAYGLSYFDVYSENVEMILKGNVSASIFQQN
jgi:hypothetical protein